MPARFGLGQSGYECGVEDEDDHQLVPQRGGALWVVAALVGVAGGVANYLLALRELPAAQEVGVDGVALLAAEIVLACWVLLGLLLVALVVPLRAGHTWAKVALSVVAVVTALLDVVNLAGSWATVAAAVVQLVFLAAAVLSLRRRPARR